MNVLDYILEGLEAELALERELGVRLVECDREVLAKLPASALTPSPARIPAPTPVSAPTPAPKPDAPPASILDFAFLHDKALSAGELEMMGKIVAALGKTVQTAPVVFDGARPDAKAYVVLGPAALKKWFPGLHGAYGQWLSAPDAPNVLYTYSPSYILRFATVTPAVKKIKMDMWQAIKSVLQKVSK